MTTYVYIDDLPFKTRKDICDILDQDKKWERLGSDFMKYDFLSMENFRREERLGNSPSEKLLDDWAKYNHKIDELFILLSRIKEYKGMSLIRNFVSEKYLFLLKNIVKDCKIPQENLNGNEKVLNNDKKIAEELNNLTIKPNVQKSPIPVRSLMVPVPGPSKGLNMSTISIPSDAAGGIPLISYEDLKKSTNNWDSSTILGKGGFGTVYKGTWKCTKVAIKKIEYKNASAQAYNDQIRQSTTELTCLNTYRHDNILPLYGYSIGGPEPCLVYQFMPGGSLDQRLRTRDISKILNWPTRLNIAIGTSRGLQYLHTLGTPLIHGDIKSANILLDLNDVPRIGDFGLAREGPQSDVTHIEVSRIQGTRPYLPEEYLRTRKLSTKVDTYSFGVVLFEIATSLAAYSQRRQKDKFLKDYVVNFEGDILEIKDPRMPGGESCFRNIIEIGKNCVKYQAKDRPEMVSVLIELEKLQET